MLNIGTEAVLRRCRRRPGTSPEEVYNAEKVLKTVEMLLWMSAGVNKRKGKWYPCQMLIQKSGPCAWLEASSGPEESSGSSRQD